MEIFEFHQGMNHHFNLTRTAQFLCPTSMIARKARLNIFAFDDWLHKKHGDYEDEGLSMSNLIEDQYGDLAHSFIISLVSYDPAL